MTNEEFAAKVRESAAFADRQTPKWGVLTHEDPFGNRFVIALPLEEAVWEKHGIDAVGQCLSCQAREMQAEFGIKTELAEGEDADALRRPLTEALAYGLEL